MTQLSDRQIIDAGKSAYEYARNTWGADMEKARDFEMYYRAQLYDDDGEPVDETDWAYRTGFPTHYANWERSKNPQPVTGPSAWYFTSSGKRRKR